ncbi:MAG TPA: pyrimidine dimer DNA glycosylase/endonuclease V [Terriglobales bacterium]|nr:pyrimidine dimer DNA glycosylase/endonuclease V [Terriglobales bacterium]
MRLWSIHPKYLDRSGLLALWRESLLAQKVLKGESKGYRSHPQLERFKKHPYPNKAIAGYLLEIWKEADNRGYNFDKRKIDPAGKIKGISVTTGQLKFEIDILKRKLKIRDDSRCKSLLLVERVETNPFFHKRKGKVETWEKMKSRKSN